jgi:hypothetical protein
VIDIPSILVTRWLVVIRTYNFIVRYIKGIENVIANILSRKPPGLSNNNNR